MRPLIEILEDERKLMQRLESVYRFILRDDEPEFLDILRTKKENIERDLDLVRIELRDRLEWLFNEDR